MMIKVVYTWARPMLKWLCGKIFLSPFENDPKNGVLGENGF